MPESRRPAVAVEEREPDDDDADEAHQRGPCAARDDDREAGQGEEARGRPDGEGAQQRRREQGRPRGQRVDLDGLGEAAGEEERGGAERGGSPVRVGAGLSVAKAETAAETHRQRGRPAGDPRRQPGQAGAEEDHHDGHGDHQHGGQLGRHRHARADRAEDGAEDGVAGDPAGDEDGGGAHGRGATLARRTARLEGCREPEHETADQRRAGRYAGCEPEQEGDDEAALAELAGAGGQVAEAGRLRDDGDGGDDQDPGAGRRPDLRVADEPGRAAHLVARLVEGLLDRGRGHRRGALDGHAAEHRGRRHLLHVREPPDELGDSDLARPAGHPLDGQGHGDQAGLGHGRAGSRDPCRPSTAAHAVLADLDGPPVQLVRGHGIAAGRAGRDDRTGGDGRGGGGDNLLIRDWRRSRARRWRSSAASSPGAGATGLAAVGAFWAWARLRRRDIGTLAPLDDRPTGFGPMSRACPSGAPRPMQQGARLPQGFVKPPQIGPDLDPILSQSSGRPEAPAASWTSDPAWGHTQMESIG